MIITKEKHQQDIKRFAEEIPTWELYAQVLNKILNNAGKLYAPLAIVQTRPKSISSFAEKIIRKSKYADPLRDMTDLCGARIITHTEEQVHVICNFIRKYFLIDEPNSLDVSERLKVSEFGYRSVHYIVTPVQDEILGVKIPDELKDKKAEIQVRTLLQHVWADILHDRMYKTALKIPNEWQRESARLAALLENSDANVSRITQLTDSFTANYGSTMPPEVLKREIATLQVILESEPIEANKPAFALRIAKMAKFISDWKLSINTLEEFIKAPSPVQDELIAEYGFALCKKFPQPKHPKHSLGINYIAKLVKPFITKDGTLIPNYINIVKAPKTVSTAIQYLALLSDERKGQDYICNLYTSAYLLNPKDPYLLAKTLEYKRQDLSQMVFINSNIAAAIHTCREHIRLGIESINAYFTIGRLALLSGDKDTALNVCLKAVSLCRLKEVCIAAEAIEEEIAALKRLQLPRESAATADCMIRILSIATAALFEDENSLIRLKSGILRSVKIQEPVVIVAGASRKLPADAVGIHEFYLIESFRRFIGTILSGGTTHGVPGLVGSAVEVARKSGNKKINLLGFIPDKMPKTVKVDPAYKIIKTSGDGFSELEPVLMWQHLIASGIKTEKVVLLGIDGGKISAFEYKLALALGAAVGVLEGSGGSASEILHDADWNSHPCLFPIPSEVESVWAFVNRNIKSVLTPEQIETTAKAIHANYVKDQTQPSSEKPNLKPWAELKDDLKNSNINQASFIYEFLLSVGLGIRKSKVGKPVLIEFTKAELEKMSHREHGRWNIERLLSGWKYGPVKDIDKKVSPYIVRWQDVPQKIQEYDFQAVRIFPELLAAAGYEIYRPDEE